LASLFNRNKGPREQTKQVRLRLRSIDIWSAVKAGFLVSIALGIATIIGAWLIWAVLANSGVFSSFGDLLGSILGDGSTLNIEEQFSFGSVMSSALTLALLNIVLTTALVAIWAALFNLISKIIGGVSVTLTNN